jgi:hypothetical protein
VAIMASRPSRENMGAKKRRKTMIKIKMNLVIPICLLLLPDVVVICNTDDNVVNIGSLVFRC